MNFDSSKKLEKLYHLKILEKEYKEKINSSIFISNIKYVETKEEAEKFISDISEKYFDATHNVYAYITNNFYKYSDDGEPSKTAGFPILDLIKKRNIINVAIVVTRYFGGTLLGTGGLVRAYSKMAKEIIDLQEIEEYVEKEYYSMEIDYRDLDNIKKIFLKNSLEIIDMEAKIKVKLFFAINPKMLDNIFNSLSEYYKIGINKLEEEINLKKEGINEHIGSRS